MTYLLKSLYVDMANHFDPSSIFFKCKSSPLTFIQTKLVKFFPCTDGTWKEFNQVSYTSSCIAAIASSPYIHFHGNEIK